MNQAEQLKERTKQFAIRIVNLFRSLPKTEEARVLGRQVLRSGTGVGASRLPCAQQARVHREAWRGPGRSRRNGVLVGAADRDWPRPTITTRLLLTEANELTSIFVVSRHTARSGRRNPRVSD